jgi:hypothetical protein
MNKPEFFIENQEWAQALESEFEQYMWNCEDLIDNEPENGFTTLSEEPFCGCSTCYTREQLFFLVPKIIKAYKEGKVTLNEE